MLDILPVKLRPLDADCDSLSQAIATAGQIAEHVSSKVRLLDKVRTNVTNTAKKVADIIDLRNCIEGVELAMRAQDYEQAAAHIQRYQSFDENLLEESRIQVLQKAMADLKKVVSEQLDQHMLKGDKEEIFRFCLLYKPLGLQAEGVHQYCIYLRGVCATECQRIKTALAESLAAGEFAAGRKLSCTDALTQMLQFAAKLIQGMGRCFNSE